jgi:DNA repair exonuclease SbcCD ATPase subunit
MPQVEVEVIMYVALGFATAALIALLLGRLMWSLAVEVGRRRAQRTSPTPVVAELQAERSRLLAEHAMMARRVEVRLDDLKFQVAEQMAEVSRSRNRVDRLSAEIDRRDAALAERDGEIARLKDQVAALTAEREGLHQDVAGGEHEIERLRGDVDRLGQASSAAVSRERTVQERLKERIEDLTALSRRIEAQRRELAVQQSHSQALREAAEQGSAGSVAGGDTPSEPVEHRLEDAERQAGELQSELDRLDEIWAAKLADVAQAVAAPPAAEPEAAPADMESPEHKPAAVNGDAGRPVGAPAPERPQDAAQAEDKKSAPGLANVISLAQRIRALQRNGS